MSKTLSIEKMSSIQKLNLVDKILLSLADETLDEETRRELEKRDNEIDVQGGLSWAAVKKMMAVNK